MYCKIEIRFDIYGIEYVKSVFRGVKFVFSDIFSLQIKLLLCHQSNLKNWMPLQWLKKSFERIRRTARVIFSHRKRWKKCFVFNSVNSIIPSNKFIFKEKSLKLISFKLSNKSHRTFMQKSTDQTPFDFFQIWNPKSICLFITLSCSSINRLKIDKNSTIKQKKRYFNENFYRSSRPEVFCKIGLLKSPAKFLEKHL